MLKTIFGRFSSSSRNFVAVTRHLSLSQHRFNQQREQSSNGSRRYPFYLAYASLPTYLAFFQKKEEDEPEKESSFLDSVLPEDIAILLKKKPVEDETTPEGKLKTTLKRTILCIHRKQYEKAEQMAHLALRMAQDIQSYDGVTLCYDIMANLALERQQYEKAQKLFESVLQRLIQKGLPQDDIMVLHLSLKVAQIVEIRNQKDDAKTNYVWTLSKLEERRKKEPEYKDLKELWGMTNHFYAKFLLQNGKFKEAYERMQIASDVFVEVRGKYEQDYVNVINDLAVAAMHVNDFDAAQKYIDETVILASAYPELSETGIYYANKGLICLKKGLLDDAKMFCKHADNASQRSNDPEGKEQAKYCIEQLAAALKNKK